MAMPGQRPPKEWSPRGEEWIVAVREVHIQPVRIFAKTAEEAVRKVAEGEGEQIEGGFEYSHTLDPDAWTVKRASER